MSRIVSDDVFTNYLHRKGKPKYPYDEWMDGKTRVMVRGEDFDWTIRTASFVDTVRRGLRRRGFEIHAEILNINEIALKVLTKEKGNHV